MAGCDNGSEGETREELPELLDFGTEKTPVEQVEADHHYAMDRAELRELGSEPGSLSRAEAISGLRPESWHHLANFVDEKLHGVEGQHHYYEVGNYDAVDKEHAIEAAAADLEKIGFKAQVGQVGELGYDEGCRHAGSQHGAEMQLWRDIPNTQCQEHLRITDAQYDKATDTWTVTIEAETPDK
ncbi:MAG: hypothetical protein KA354_17170 [Phycisphaerae bacterium]|nr:hypothetical protein [Phycisphaerae bacterium]